MIKEVCIALGLVVGLIITATFIDNLTRHKYVQTHVIPVNVQIILDDLYYETLGYTYFEYHNFVPVYPPPYVYNIYTYRYNYK